MEAKIGDRVSINPDKRAYFFQTEGGLNLIAGSAEESAIIPKTATEEHLNQINMALRTEHLVIGRANQTAEVPSNDNDLRQILEQGRNKVSTWIGQLQDDKKIKSTVKVVKLEKLIEFERAGKNREAIIDFAEAALSFIGGTSSVIDSDQEKVEIKLVPPEEVQDEPVESKTVKIK